MNIVISFLVSFLDPVRFHLVGDLTAGEVFIPVLFLINWKRSLCIICHPLVAKILTLFFLYFLMLIFADLWRNIEPMDYLRGWAKLGIMGLSTFAFLGALWDRPKAIIAFVFGGVLSIIIRFGMEGIPAISPDSYKWWYGTPLTLTGVAISGYLWPRSRLLATGLVIAMGSLSFLMNFRSLAALTLLSACVMVWSDSIARLQSRVYGGKLIFATTCGLIACIGILQFYAFAAPAGWLGAPAKEKYEVQAKQTGREFSLLSGRNESLFAVPKILESPFIGLGSWAKDKGYVKKRHKQLHGNKHLGGVAGSEGVIPTHSHILSGALEAGIMGGLFWIGITWIVFRNIIYVRRPETHTILWPLIIFLSVVMFWDLLFSPFGGSRRVGMGFLVALHLIIAMKMGYSRLNQIEPFKGLSFESHQT